MGTIPRRPPLAFGHTRVDGKVVVNDKATVIISGSHAFDELAWNN